MDRQNHNGDAGLIRVDGGRGDREINDDRGHQIAGRCLSGSGFWVANRRRCGTLCL
jgi:hypothetical protein